MIKRNKPNQIERKGSVSNARYAILFSMKCWCRCLNYSCRSNIANCIELTSEISESCVCACVRACVCKIDHFKSICNKVKVGKWNDSTVPTVKFWPFATGWFSKKLVQISGYSFRWLVKPCIHMLNANEIKCRFIHCNKLWSFIF